MKLSKSYLIVIALMAVICQRVHAQRSEPVWLSHVTVIDGTGKPPQPNMHVIIKDGNILSISKMQGSSSFKIIDMSGKTIMPLMTNVHAHLGMAKGTSVAPENFSREQIIKELIRYQSYGVGTIVSMGTDKELIFSLRNEARSGKLPGAAFYTAGYGFRPPLGNRPVETGMERIYRPATAQEAIQDVKELAVLKPDMIKIWVDDTGMTPEVYTAIITEAHKHGIRVAAHLYYLEDAHKLLDAGVDIFAHSIRDKEVDDALISKMKAKGTIYIPTLTRDAYEFFYGTQRPWINDPFFTASLEPGVHEMITSEGYKKQIIDNPRYPKNKEAFAMALKNLKKMFDGGVLIAMGTDSGATPVRAQGFSEHLELQLMVEAGLTPLQAISIASRNSCQALGLPDQGTLTAGKRADFIVLEANPASDIQATRKIHSVWKQGVQVSGPLGK